MRVVAAPRIDSTTSCCKAAPLGDGDKAKAAAAASARIPLPLFFRDTYTAPTKRTKACSMASNPRRLRSVASRCSLRAAGMARRSGGMIGGAGKLAADTEGFAGLMAAPDASSRELAKLQSRLGVEWTSRLLTAEELGQLFGRDSLAFAGIRGGGKAKPAENLHRELTRLEGFSWSSACQAG